ncbi:hypothetical protein ZIOFF_017125 [Zingiber officinale]|uniref:dUTP diphosphatase n=1 Tax=Zingiber officinale TaxID=94328 RepID=A0A8J5LL32_ZINOF|nr:hypothetical protein ZIOFF_017125 [Zingiber officinale]
MAATRIEQQVATTPLFEDQIRSYRRNQRHLYNTQQAARRIERQLTGGGTTRYTLEQQLEPEAQLQLSMQERASIVPAEVLYHSRRDDAHHQVYVHRSEKAILVTDNHQVDRNFIQEESFAHLRRSRMQYTHLGVLQVRIQILHRQYEGTMALVVFRDNRWQGDQAILATMEVDLTRGSQMIYVIPEVIMTIGDFYRNIQISILTRGYEAWQNSEANLLITRGSHGLFNLSWCKCSPWTKIVNKKFTRVKLGNKPNSNFNTNATRGGNSQTMMNGRISLSFNNYTAALTPKQSKYNDKDEEILAVLIETKPGVYVYYDGEADDYYEEQKSKYKTGRWDTLGQPSGKFDYYVNYDIPEIPSFPEIPPTGWDDEVGETNNSQKEESIAASERYSSTTEPYILINKITPNAVTPLRQSEGSAGFDISASHAAVIEPYGRDLIHTGLRIEIPYGYYGRLASRSGLAWKTRIEVGAGVIDSDYR